MYMLQDGQMKFKFLKVFCFSKTVDLIYSCLFKIYKYTVKYLFKSNIFCATSDLKKSSDKFLVLGRKFFTHKSLNNSPLHCRCFQTCLKNVHVHMELWFVILWDIFVVGLEAAGELPCFHSRSEYRVGCHCPRSMSISVETHKPTAQKFKTMEQFCRAVNIIWYSALIIHFYSWSFYMLDISSIL